MVIKFFINWLLSFFIFLTFFVVALTSPYFYSTRSLALGGAFSAIADDASAIFYNPAGLSLASLEFSSQVLDYENQVYDLSDFTYFKLYSIAYSNFNLKNKNLPSLTGQVFGFGTEGQYVSSPKKSLQ